MMHFLFQVRKSVSIIIVCSFSCSATQAQGLQVGDPIINLELTRILNYPADSARLKDFIGNKALLIDFWFSSCASCIESFPKLDSIQKEFKDDLNILIVTFEKKEKVLHAFKTINSIKHIELYSVVEDTLLHLIFPHTSAPHEIWIDKQGKIKGITDHTSINRKNIASLVSGIDFNLPVKKDNIEYTSYEPLVKHMDMNKMLKYNIISSYQPGLPTSDGMYLHPDNGFLRAVATNVHFQSLYIIAYNQWGKGFNYNRIVIDKSVIDRFAKTEAKNNIYCYDGWWRDTSTAKACLEMGNELDRFFNLTSYSKKRKVRCLILRQKGSKRRFTSTNPEERQDTYYENDTLYLKNVFLKYPIETVLNYGKYAWSPFQFIDETGYREKVNIRLPKKFESVAQVNRFLKDSDLEVRIEKRWLDVIILKDKIKQ